MEPHSLYVYICIERHTPLDPLSTDYVSYITTNEKAARAWITEKALDTPEGDILRRTSYLLTIANKLGISTYNVFKKPLYGVIPYEPAD